MPSGVSGTCIPHATCTTDFYNAQAVENEIVRLLSLNNDVMGLGLSDEQINAIANNFINSIDLELEGYLESSTRITHNMVNRMMDQIYESPIGWASGIPNNLGDNWYSHIFVPPEPVAQSNLTGMVLPNTFDQSASDAYIAAQSYFGVRYEDADDVLREQINYAAVLILNGVELNFIGVNGFNDLSSITRDQVVDFINIQNPNKSIEDIDKDFTSIHRLNSTALTNTAGVTLTQVNENRRELYDAARFWASMDGEIGFSEAEKNAINDLVNDIQNDTGVNFSYKQLINYIYQNDYNLVQSGHILDRFNANKDVEFGNVLSSEYFDAIEIYARSDRDAGISIDELEQINSILASLGDNYTLDEATEVILAAARDRARENGISL